MKAGTIHFLPECFNDILHQRDTVLAKDVGRTETTFCVSNCTTLFAANELVKSGPSSVLCLNFASAMNPGGGFIGSRINDQSDSHAIWQD